MDSFLLDWSRRQFGPDIAPEVAAVYAQYFNIPYQRDDKRFGERFLHSRFRDLDKGSPLTSGKLPGPTLQGHIRDTLTLAAQCRPYVADLVAKAESLVPRVPAPRRDFYIAHAITPARVHLHSLEMLEAYTQALEACGKRDKAQVLAKVDESLNACDAIFTTLHRAEAGKWSGWFFGERFVGIEQTRDRLRTIRAALRGEPAPPPRTSSGYPELYQYQERFQPNFPLLYPQRAGNTP
jgi:hypothetical protein